MRYISWLCCCEWCRLRTFVPFYIFWPFFLLLLKFYYDTSNTLIYRSSKNITTKQQQQHMKVVAIDPSIASIWQVSPRFLSAYPLFYFCSVLIKICPIIISTELETISHQNISIEIWEDIRRGSWRIDFKGGWGRWHWIHHQLVGRVETG